MALRISYNKAQELANAIEGAEVKTYDNGNVAIVLNARVVNPSDGMALLEPLTKYNKPTVSYEEAGELIKEPHQFILNGNKLKGSWADESGEDIYVIESYGIVIAERHTGNLWYFHPEQIETVKGREFNKVTMRKHMAFLLETLGRSPIEEADVIANKEFGL